MRFYAPHHYSLAQTAAPAVEPVDLATAKLWCKQDLGADDAIFNMLIPAARGLAEKFCARYFVNQTWNLFLDAFPSVFYTEYITDREEFYGSYSAFSSIFIPNPPLVSVNSVQYIDQTTGVLTTLSPSTYLVDTSSEPARLQPVYGGSWPVALPVPNSIVVNFTGGYSADASKVPNEVKVAILEMVYNMYVNRSEISAIESYVVPKNVARLLTPFKIVSF